MKIRIIFSCLLCIFFGTVLFAQSDSVAPILNDNQLVIVDNQDTLTLSDQKPAEFKYRESKRFVAAVLCLALGPFGMHRLYLGTSPQVAAAYSITLGAIGLVPVVDFFLISFSKDISRFKNNDRVIMWGKL